MNLNLYQSSRNTQNRADGSRKIAPQKTEFVDTLVMWKSAVFMRKIEGLQEVLQVQAIEITY